MTRRTSPEQVLAQELGTALFASLFAGEVLALLRRASDRLGTGERLLVRLRLPAALTAVPWELLYDPEQGAFLALDRRRSLLRYVEAAQPPPPLRVDGPLEVVVVLASPTGYPALNLDREWRRVQAALAASVAQGRIRLRPPIRGPRTLGQLRAALREPIHVLHVVSHGEVDQPVG